MNTDHNMRMPTLGRIKRLLSWPSGAIPSVLAHCPTELNYYCGLGTLVWFTSILAGCGMALMLGQIGGSTWRAFGGGVFWFLCVLNLDRFLLLASYESSGWKKLIPVGRILLSLCIAIIIGEHFVHYIFHNEINYQLTQERLEAKRGNYDKALQGFPEITALNEEKKAKQSEIERNEVVVTKLRDDYIREAEGTAGSRIRGKGPLYEQKQRDYETALSDKQNLLGELREINDHLEAKNVQLRGVVQSADEAKATERGFLAHHRALFEIIKKNPTLLLLYVVISSAMILFEITPLISKLSANRKLHDHLAEKEMELRKSEEDERHAARLRSSKSENESNRKLAEKFFQLQIDTLDEVTNSIRSNAHSSLGQDKGDLAQLIKAQVYRNIVEQINLTRGRGEREQSDETQQANFDGDNPSCVTVVVKGSDTEKPFAILFRQPQARVRGADLIYALAGLEKHRPATSEPRIPFKECRATNAQGELIDMDKQLFPQIRQGSSAVYLSAFEATVSTAEN